MIRAIKRQYTYVKWDIVYGQSIYVGSVYGDSSIICVFCPKVLKDKVEFLVKLLEKERQKDE